MPITTFRALPQEGEVVVPQGTPILSGGRVIGVVSEPFRATAGRIPVAVSVTEGSVPVPAGSVPIWNPNRNGDAFIWAPGTLEKFREQLLRILQRRMVEHMPKTALERLLGDDEEL